MKKLLMALCVISCVGLTACETPTAIRPYVNGPVYYKQPECVTYKAFPKTISRWNYNLGVNETYVTNEKVTKTICNYNPYTNPQNFNNLYGRS